MRAFKDSYIFLFLSFFFLTAALSCEPAVPSRENPYESIDGNQAAYKRGQTNHHEDPFETPPQSDESPAEKSFLSDYINLEKNSRYVDTALMALHTTLCAGAYIANTFFTISSPLKLLNPVFMCGALASSVNAIARWTNWFYSVKSPEKSPYKPPFRDTYHLKKLAFLTDLSYLTLFVIPVTISSQDEPYPIFPFMMALTGGLSLWTLYNAKVLFYDF